MAIFGPTPLFHGIAVVVDFDESIGNARVVHADICGLVQRLEEKDATIDELLDAIPSFIGLYDLTARSVEGSAKSIRFSVRTR